MIANKHITKIVAVITAFIVGLCFFLISFSDRLTAVCGIEMEYEDELFDTDKIISVNIIMDESQWSEMLENATSEEYYKCDVQINGKTFYSVGIRPKGNTSLQSIAKEPDNNRYSFKLEFDQFVEGQTCFGLDKLILNNNYADATNMKEALIYDMFEYLGADASLYNYAQINVNGQYWGVYTAIEAVEESFMLRNYGAVKGQLYKPESMNMGGGGQMDPGGQKPGNMAPPQNNGFNGMPDFPGGNNQMPENAGSPQMVPGQDANTDNSFAENNNIPQDQNESDPAGMPDINNPGFPQGDNGGGHGFSMGGNGADLNYTDDNAESYSTVWDGEITDTSKSDHTRVIKALKNISEGTDTEKYMDTDNLVKYMAAHIFAVNEDSLSGNMAHNYYLYEHNGQLNIIPWDYNLSFGGMGGGSDASSVINDAIDMPFSGTDFFNCLLEDEEYCSEYYASLQKLTDEYISGGNFEKFYLSTRSKIDELVKNDPNALYTYDEYVAAADTLYNVVQLRGESIKGQLEGTIPSTQSGQQEDSSSLIDASGIDLSVMGSMDMGGNGQMQGRPDQIKQNGENTDEAVSLPQNGFDPQGAGENMTNGENFDGAPSQQQNSFDPQGAGENMTNGENFDGAPSQQQNGFDPQNAGANVPDGENFDGAAPQQNGWNPQNKGENMPDDQKNMPDISKNTDKSSGMHNNVILYGISGAVMIAGLVFAVLYRRKSVRR